ncbi:MAG: helix-turn-helix domain-containing protein [Afipia sp.]
MPEISASAKGPVEVSAAAKARPAVSPARNLPRHRPSDSKAICPQVLACVTHDFRVDPGCMMAPSRGSPRVSLARQVAMYLCHVAFAMSFAAIGRAFGRDRTTVAHACRAIEDRRDDIWFDCRIAALERACGVDTGERAR